MLRGRSVGVIHSLDASLPATTVTGIGVAARVLGDAAAGRRVLDPEGEEAYGDVLEAGQELAKSGADVVVVGCTGMTRLRARLQGEPGSPWWNCARPPLSLQHQPFGMRTPRGTDPLIDSTPTSGLVTIAVTPLDEDWNTDLPSIPTLMDLCVACGSSGVALPGVMGEANRMTEVEPTRGRERHRHRRREDSGHRRGIGGHLSMPGRADGGRLRSVRRRRNSDDCSRPAVG